jgi:hypothetical protein
LVGSETPGQVNAGKAAPGAPVERCAGARFAVSSLYRPGDLPDSSARESGGMAMTDSSFPADAVEGTDHAALRAIRRRIAMAEQAAGRPPGSVTLIAVSKTFDADAIAPVIAAGQRVFGENRVQEAKGKWPALQAATPGIELHLIGPLQTNKVREAVDLFDTLHTLDRDRLAAEIAKAQQRSGRRPGLFVQVNTGREAQKAGIDPAEAVDFVVRCRAVHGLHVQGLMCIPPVDDAPAAHFRLLAELARSAGLTELSMGMSSDFETAIACGATHVRVGSALFGAR